MACRATGSASRAQSAEVAEEAGEPQTAELEQGSAAEAVQRGLLNSGTRPSACQAALFQDRQAAGNCSWPHPVYFAFSCITEVRHLLCD